MKNIIGLLAVLLYAPCVFAQPVDGLNPSLNSVTSNSPANFCGYSLPTSGARYCMGSTGCYLTHNASGFIDAVCGNGLRVGSAGGQLRMAQSTPIWFGTAAAADQADIINFDTLGTFEFSGSTSNGASAIATRVSAQADLTTAGAKITCFGDNAGVSVSDKACVDLNGNYSNNSLAGVAGSGTGYTTDETALARTFVHKITITRAALTAAATTEDETPWTLPAKTRLTRVVIDVTQAFDDAAGPISAVTVQCGPSAGSTAYVPATSVFTVNTIGDVAAEIGASLLSATVADIPSFSSTTAISCRFTSTGGNLSTLTTGSATFYIEGTVFP